MLPGESFWLIYALIGLIQDTEEPIILSRGQDILLIYNRSAYIRRVHMTSSDIPQRKGHYVLALIDTDTSIAPPPLLVSKYTPVFPVHASSPSPEGYRWVKQRRVLTVGMPLWTVQELYTGCVKLYNFLHGF